MQTASAADDVQKRLEQATLDKDDGVTPNDQYVQVAAATDQPDHDLAAKIVKQVNFYFSDTNLPTDKYLLTQVRKTPEGWVPVRLIAGFKKMKSLTKDLTVIVAALETSPELEISGHRVRRKLPLPFVDETEVLLRTVIAENLPPQPTIDSLTKKFSVSGDVKMVRICQPNSGPRSTAQTIPGVSHQQHALIEFSSKAEADTAVQQLTDNDNWRSGLRVRPLLRPSFKPQQQQAKSHTARQQTQQKQAAARMQETGRQQPAQSSQYPENQGQEDGLVGGEADRNFISQAQASTMQQGQSEAQASQANSSSVGAEAQSNAAMPHADQIAGGQPKGGKPSSKGQKSKRGKKDYAAWAGATAETRAIATAHLEGNPDLVNVSQPMHAGPVAAPGSSQPAAPGMPDGTRGFSFGRGRAMNAAASGS